MHDLNDDMDRLIRRAAEEYPLNTNSADWNKLLSVLQGKKNNTNNKNFANKFKSYKNPFLLLLLVSIPLICNDNMPALWPYRGLATLPKTSAPAADYLNSKRDRDEQTTAKKKPFAERGNRGGKPNHNKSVVNPRFTTNNNTNKENINRGHDAGSRSQSYSSPLIKISANRVIERKSLENIAADTKTGEKNVATPNMEVTTARVEKKLFNSGDTSTNNSASETKKTVSIEQSKTRGFYIGVLAGPDVSTIKLQAINKVGFSAGVIVGYELNKKIKIESGIIWDKKYYYTDGKYFKPRNSYIPSYVRINYLDGNCGMIELPVNIVYRVKQLKKNNLFATVGLSSYIMKREEYYYNATRNGNTYSREVTYKNSGTNWFSIMNIGLSYHFALPKSFGLRIQPYVKLPLGGLGTGQLPISSTGVYLVLTRKMTN